MRRNIAIILAGGQGVRFNQGLPKQFAKLAGKTVIEHTIDIFNRHEQIDEIAVVINPGYVDKMEGLALNNNWGKLKRILLGGKERADSSRVAIEAYREEADANLLFHDAVRPMVDPATLNAVIRALENYRAVDVAIPATDTIIEVDPGSNTIADIPDRRRLQQGQTPQAFRVSAIAQAYDLASQDPAFRATDDCGVVRRYLPEEPIYVVKGARKNLKLTHIEDLYFLDKLYQLNSLETQGEIDAAALKDKVLVVFGGNAGIGKEICRMAEEYGARTYSFSRRSSGTDISRAEDVDQAFGQVMRLESRVDYVVVSAAILRKEPFHAMSREDIDAIIDINYKGMVYVSQAAYPYLRESKGQLLHFTSSSYTLGRPLYSLYSSSKAAVVNFVQALSQEWAAQGIRVNCINPERTLTEMRVRNFGHEDPATLLSAEEVAQAAIRTLLGEQSGLIVDVKLHG